MTRPSFDEIYMRLAFLMAKRSTCLRTGPDGLPMQVGCVITTTNHRRVLSVGYNGNAAGLPNGCDDPTAIGACGCFLPGTSVSAFGVRRAYRRRYEGDVVRIITARGDFTCTPNHPILATGMGWIAAERLTQGDHLFHTVGDQNVPPHAPYDYDGVPIEDVFESLRVSGMMVRRPGARHHFHGDGLLDQDVDVVSPDRRLGPNVHVLRRERVGQPHLSGADLVPTSFRGLSLSFATSLASAGRARFPGGSSLDGVDTSLVKAQIDHVATNAERVSDLFGGFPCPVPIDDVGRQFEHRLAFVSDHVLGHLAKHPAFAKSHLDRGVRNTDGFGDGEDRLTGLIATDEILHVERYAWAGHVFNLQTRSGWYYAGRGGTIAQNCLHAEENTVIACREVGETPKRVYCTHLPCVACAKRIIQLEGVREVVWSIPYRKVDALALLEKVGIETRRYTVEEP